ncbi:MAG: carboxylating nicotinate-nucleotide diphosphorylase [Proteobacteria bacterium]|nr:carboxylating nicotinate-nucleotide diphosphorylase [Pseudomonadota bacterium]
MPRDDRKKSRQDPLVRAWAPQWNALSGVAALVELALAEDVGTGDMTTDALVDDDAMGRAVILAKETLVVAGLEVAETVFSLLDMEVEFLPACEDGDSLAPGAVLAEVEGRMRALLTGERTALNFLQRLSGVATQTRRFASQAGNLGVRVTDTRKTTPGWRVLEKYAVRVGGASNHRMGLFDGVLIKDNHIAACGGIAQAVEKARQNLHHLTRVEVETGTLDQVAEALDAGVDVIMLDNMDDETIAEAVQVISGRALVEVSGNVTGERLPTLALLGVDIVSAGALTHSARAMDISMRIRAI